MKKSRIGLFGLLYANYPINWRVRHLVWTIGFGIPTGSIGSNKQTNINYLGIYVLLLCQLVYLDITSYDSKYILCWVNFFLFLSFILMEHELNNKREKPEKTIWDGFWWKPNIVKNLFESLTWFWLREREWEQGDSKYSF